MGCVGLRDGLRVRMNRVVILKVAMISSQIDCMNEEFHYTLVWADGWWCILA